MLPEIMSLSFVVYFLICVLVMYTVHNILGFYCIQKSLYLKWMEECYCFTSVIIGCEYQSLSLSIYFYC